MATRRKKKRIRRKYGRPRRGARGHPPLTLMRVPMIRVRTSQRRTQRLLGVLVQSSSRPRVLELSHTVVPLPPQEGEVQWQETWVPGWPRLQDRRRSKSRLTQLFFSFFWQSSVREVLLNPLRRECDYMPSRASKFLPSLYFSACLFCISCPVFVVSCTETSGRKLISLTKTEHKGFLRKNHLVWLNARHEGTFKQGNEVELQSLFTHTIVHAFLTF